MITRLKVVSTTAPPRSPEREALVEVKASYDAALEEERALEDVLSSVRETRRRARGALAKASEDGKQGKTAKELRAAREAHQNHQDEIEATQNRENELKKRREQLATLQLRRMKFESALAAAVASDPATAALFQEFDAVKARFVSLVRAIEALSGEMVPQDRRDAFFHGPGLCRRLSVTELLANSRELPSSVAARWRDAIAALATDPDAELPSV